jgi:hypothetical protein
LKLGIIERGASKTSKTGQFLIQVNQKLLLGKPPKIMLVQNQISLELKGLYYFKHKTIRIFAVIINGFYPILLL